MPRTLVRMRRVILVIVFQATILAACDLGPAAQFDEALGPAPTATSTPSPVPAVTTPASAPTRPPPTPARVAAPRPVVTTAPEPSPGPTATQAPTPTPTPSATPTATPGPTPAPEPTATPVPRPPLAGLELDLVANGFGRPTFVGHAGDDRLFVLEKAGRIRIVVGGLVLPQPFLDIRGRVGSQANEQGLLGLAFHPDYAANGRFFLNYTDPNGDTVVAEYRVSPSDPNRADPDLVQTLLELAQPFGNHNGGMLAFGPDGMLYIATGDGGSSGDPRGNGQNLGVLLGKLLRIDVNQTSGYAVPPDNPFVDDPNARGEIWAFGLRNPWRFSFDRETGDLYIADVGQNTIEEIDVELAPLAGGRNYGWNILEGSQCSSLLDQSPCARDDLVPPAAEYDHSLGCSVTGGYVYRGTAQPALVGSYLFADYCSGIIWTLDRDADGRWRMQRRAEVDALISSFGEDVAGELYVTSDRDGRLYRVRAVTPA